MADDGTQGAFGGAAQGAAAGSAFGPWGALIGGVAGGVTGWAFGQEAARRKRREVDEAVRRLRDEHLQTEGLARAAGAASGVEFDSTSLQTYLDQMSAEFRRQEDWMRRTGYSSARSGEVASDIGLGSDLASSLFGFARSNNWWRQTPPALSQGGR